MIVYDDLFSFSLFVLICIFFGECIALTTKYLFLISVFVVYSLSFEDEFVMMVIGLFFVFVGIMFCCDDVVCVMMVCLLWCVGVVVCFLEDFFFVVVICFVVFGVDDVWSEDVCVCMIGWLVGV